MSLTPAIDLLYSIALHCTFSRVSSLQCLPYIFSIRSPPISCLAAALNPIPASRKALGVPAGPLRGQLKSGEKVSLENGVVVSPEDVLGQAIPGISSAIHLDNIQLCAAVVGVYIYLLSRAITARLPSHPRAFLRYICHLMLLLHNAGAAAAVIGCPKVCSPGN